MSAVKNIKPILLIPVLASAVLMNGCVSKDMSDLEQYAQEVHARKGGKVEPLPPIKPYQRYLYRSADLGLRDPFLSFSREPENVDTPEKTIDPRQQEFANEILTHNRQELELHELDALRMVGILENPEHLWGIVVDPDGTVHRVEVGNYLGRNFGKIINIQEDRIDIREIIKDSQGRYEERQAALALAEQ